MQRGFKRSEADAKLYIFGHFKDFCSYINDLNTKI